MLKVIQNTFFLFINKIGNFTLFIIPLLAINTFNLPILANLVFTSVLGIVISFLIYVYILRTDDTYLLKSWRLLLKFAFADCGISSIFYLIIFIAQKFLGPINPYLSYALIYLGGLYFLTRFSIILPMLINNESISFKNIIQRTNERYLLWLMAGTIIYLPFVLARIYFDQGFAYQLISALQIPWLCCFNACYIKRT